MNFSVEGGNKAKLKTYLCVEDVETPMNATQSRQQLLTFAPPLPQAEILCMVLSKELKFIVLKNELLLSLKTHRAVGGYCDVGVFQMHLSNRLHELFQLTVALKT